MHAADQEFDWEPGVDAERGRPVHYMAVFFVLLKLHDGKLSNKELTPLENPRKLGEDLNKLKKTFKTLRT